jgi:ABC-type multidrug transport system permease subunit
MAPFFSAACQNFTTICGRHTLSETMYTFTAAFMGLVSTFFSWHRYLFFLLLKIVSIYAAGTILLLCERAAKVRKYFNCFEVQLHFFAINRTN